MECFTALRDHIPPKQGLRLNTSFELAISFKTQRPYPTKTRIKTCHSFVILMLIIMSQRPYPTKTRIKTRLLPENCRVKFALRDHIPPKQGLRLQ